MKLGNRYSQHSFAQIPDIYTARSRFDRSSSVKTTFDFDYLVPIFVDEIIPGDTMNLNVKSFVRMSTQVKPVLDNMYIDYFGFFVPFRLVWDNSEKFFGYQENPGDSTDYLIPQLVINTGTGVPNGSIFDQFGIVPEVDDISVNALPFRAYNLIWNEWFRDQNVQNSVLVSKDDGPDGPAEFTLLRRNKNHDYFTSGLPWPQKGDAVTMGLSGPAPVYGTSMLTSGATGGHNWQSLVNGTAPTGSININANATSTSRTLYGVGMAGSTFAGAGLALGTEDSYLSTPDTEPPYADLEQVNIAINTFRQAMMMQSFLELDARGGTRYVEILRAHYNVVAPDFRLQRPELLFVSSTTISQHPVAQNSESGTTPQGNLAAFSTAVNLSRQVGFDKTFVEHGYVIVLAQARADVTYQQGINRMWWKTNREELFWSKFQQLGEQATLMREIYVTGSADDLDVHSYQERYAEYRYKPSEIRGQFRSSYAQSLDVWHMAQEFEDPPVLASPFIESDTPVERNLAVPTAPHLLADFWFDLKHARPMMTYGVPATLGRF